MNDRRLFEDIAERIVTLIGEGAFPTGSRLPGERELSERFGVSRVTIREAEIALQARGWVKIKNGAGVYVCEGPATPATLPNVSAFELTEARSLFEAEAAALAAPIIPDTALAKLDALLTEMRDDALGDDEVSVIDRDFHLTIAAATGNHAIIHVIESLWRLRLELPAVRASHATICRKDGKARMDEHVDIVLALKAHDAKGARLAMRKHFNRLLESMLTAAEEIELHELRRRTAESRARFMMSAQLT